MDKEKPFKEGEEVYLDSCGELKPATVSKVYRTGNFRISHSRKKYSPSGIPTRMHSEPPRIVRHKTPDLDGRYQAQQMVVTRATLIATLISIDPKLLTEAGLSSIEAAIKEMQDVQNKD